MQLQPSFGMRRYIVKDWDAYKQGSHRTLEEQLGFLVTQVNEKYSKGDKKDKNNHQGTRFVRRGRTPDHVQIRVLRGPDEDEIQCKLSRSKVWRTQYGKPFGELFEARFIESPPPKEKRKKPAEQQTEASTEAKPWWKKKWW